MIGIFLDLETTGLDHMTHRVLEIAFRIRHIDTGKELSHMEAVICQPSDVWAQRDPKSIEVNGFTEDRMSHGRNEASVAQEIVNTFTEAGISRSNAVFVCQNPSFDRVFFSQLVPVYQQEQLNWPYHWLDLASMYWSSVVRHALRRGEVLPQRIPLSKDDIAASYELPPEESPHRAMNGVDHLIQCYDAVMRAETAPTPRM